MDWIKVALVSTILLIVGVLSFSLNGLYKSQSIIKIVSAEQEPTLLPILDLCERPLQYPIGSPEEIKQSEEASELYKRGLC